jgi:hypothetical protein
MVQLPWYNFAYTLDFSCHGGSPTTSKRTAFESFGNPTILEGQGWPPIFSHLPFTKGEGKITNIFIVAILEFRSEVYFEV